MPEDFRAIIDASGLPSAAPYYQAFPREPSPAGAMKVERSKTVALANIHLGAVLDQMARVGTGGVVLLVCHGVSTGLLIPLAPGGGLDATADSLEVIATVGTIHDESKAIRAMPEKTDDEKNAKLAAWREFFRRRKIVEITGEFTLREAAKAFQDWLNNQGKRLLISSAALLALVTKSRAVQAKKLKRVEIRACSAGKNKDTMKVLKAFFGCEALLAPKATTFYLTPIFVDSVANWPSVVHWDPGHLERLRGGRLPGPLGRLTPENLRAQGKRRFFFGKHAAFTMSIWEIAAFKFAGMGAAGRRLSRGAHPRAGARLVLCRGLRQRVHPSHGELPARPVSGRRVLGTRGQQPALGPAQREPVRADDQPPLTKRRGRPLGRSSRVDLGITLASSLHPRTAAPIMAACGISRAQTFDRGASPCPPIRPSAFRLPPRSRPSSPPGFGFIRSPDSSWPRSPRQLRSRCCNSPFPCFGRPRS